MDAYADDDKLTSSISDEVDRAAPASALAAAMPPPPAAPTIAPVAVAVPLTLDQVIERLADLRTMLAALADSDDQVQLAALNEEIDKVLANYRR